MKKFVLFALILVAVFCVATPAAAMTEQERQILIAQIQAQIAQLTQLLNQIIAEQNQSASNNTANTTPGTNTTITQNPTPTAQQTVCTPSWLTGTWGECANNVQTRPVIDANDCGVTAGKPVVTQSCTSSSSNSSSSSLSSSSSGPSGSSTASSLKTCALASDCSYGSVCNGGICCTPKWNCSAWGNCIRNQLRRSCSDLNNCGTDQLKPNEIQVCNVSATSSVSSATASQLVGGYSPNSSSVASATSAGNSTGGNAGTSATGSGSSSTDKVCGPWSCFTQANNTTLGTRMCIIVDAKTRKEITAEYQHEECGKGATTFMGGKVCFDNPGCYNGLQKVTCYTDWYYSDKPPIYTYTYIPCQN